LIVGGGVVERLEECAALRCVERWIVEPMCAEHGTLELADYPFFAKRVGNADARDFARRVVSRDEDVTLCVPTIIAGIVNRRKRRLKLTPPLDRFDLERLESHDVAGRAFAMTGDAERHRWPTANVANGEALLVELQLTEGLCGTLVPAP
jgi:hypothetical protein